MESVGEKLRDARQKLALTLDQVHARTRISLKYLEAIERDNPACFPSPFFYKSYVRQLAEALNVEYRLIAPGVETIATAIPEPLMPGQGDAQLPKAAPMPPPRPKRGRLRWLYSLGSLLTMFALCSAAYSVMH
jgi:transcriptional regulator with XRE-family HTH domain